MTRFRPPLVVVLLALATQAAPVVAGVGCGIGVPACCTGDGDCNDLDGCNGIEACEVGTGTCLAGVPVVCSDGNQCTADVCVPATGLCKFPSVADDTPCDDADACTQTDTCQSGTCTGAQPVICDDTNACTADACVPATGLCNFTLVADDTPCDDADACTQTDTCQSGTCTGAQPIVCDDGNDCTTDGCIPALGLCNFPHVADDTPCDDANACTQTDTCQSGMCTGAQPITCDDTNACTADACIPATGLCDFTPVPDDIPCDDTDACTQTDTCQSGICTGAQPVDCDDANACTADTCAPATGVCSHVTVADTTPCDDGDGCTQTDACVAGACVGTNPLVCDDGIPCTTDACAGGLCTAIPVDAQCPDGECFDGRCDPTDAGADGLGCVPSPVRDGDACTDDGVSCTDDLCATGLCVHMPVHAMCVADDVCAMATCAPGDATADTDGCVVSPGQPDGAICTEDLDPCTRDLCSSGTCAHEDVADLTACDPVRDPFRKALVLAAFGTELRAEIAVLAGLYDSRRAGLLLQVDRVVTALGATAAELNGADPDADTAKARATNALGPLKRLPREARRLVRLIKLAGKRDPVDPLEAERLRRSGDDLRRGVRELKRDVRRLRRALRRFLQ